MTPASPDGTREPDLDHYYKHGDVYEVLDACRQLELNLAMLKRGGHMDLETWSHCDALLTEMLSAIESCLEQ